jgi:hypothetical protein
VDLQHSNSHQSYYTCLSRCASAKGTLIMQSLQPSVITGGCSGWLQQEFRDLEILDEITRLAFHSKLMPEINGHCGNTLIKQFRTWKGLNYVPENLHPAIKWSAQQPYPSEVEVQDIQWKIVVQNEKLNSNLKSSTSSTPNFLQLLKGASHFSIRLLNILVLNEKLTIKMNYMQLKNQKHFTIHVKIPQSKKMKKNLIDQIKNKDS